MVLCIGIIKFPLNYSKCLGKNITFYFFDKIFLAQFKEPNLFRFMAQEDLLVNQFYRKSS